MRVKEKMGLGKNELQNFEKATYTWQYGEIIFSTNNQEGSMI